MRFVWSCWLVGGTSSTAAAWCFRRLLNNHLNTNIPSNTRSPNTFPLPIPNTRGRSIENQDTHGTARTRVKPAQHGVVQLSLKKRIAYYTIPVRGYL
ncbi:unnamed protein product [Periconia digitata]|uniref:Secreted protein n=1 Tax=Periconia digitata TaxID=1303443 RepID=A0A9W4XFB8_9PLEO|nr:unnamed protein product [Periconia digitata]